MIGKGGDRGNSPIERSGLDSYYSFARERAAILLEGRAGDSANGGALWKQRPPCRIPRLRLQRTPFPSPSAPLCSRDRCSAKDAPHGCTGGPKSDADISLWDCSIAGPADTPFEGGTFKLTLQFPPGPSPSAVRIGLPRLWRPPPACRAPNGARFVWRRNDYLLWRDAVEGLLLLSSPVLVAAARRSRRGCAATRIYKLRPFS